MSDNVLILGGGLQALSTAHSLWKKGISACCIAEDHEEIKHSRFIHAFYPFKAKDFLPYLLDIVSKEKIGLIIPMSDYMADFLSRHKQQIESECRAYCPVPEYSTFIQGADKSSLMSFCAEHGFAHPRTFALSDTNIEKAADEVGFPAIIKPNRSVGARGITPVRSLKELQVKYPDINKRYGCCTLQEYIDCEGDPYYNVMLYRSRDGKILGYTIIEILRYFPIKAGSSSLCRTVEEPALLAECTKVLDKLNWEGMADFDVLRNKKGEYKIIEINPRVPASLRAADIAGVNFPEIMLHDALGLPKKDYSYQTNRYLRYFGLDIMWLINSPERFKAKPCWLLSIGRKTYFQDIYAQDHHTWFAWLVSGFQRFLEKRKHLNN